MGRSYISIGMAAVFGLLVAAVVAIHEYTAPVSAEVIATEAAAARSFELHVVRAEDDTKCGMVTQLVRTPRATVHVSAAVGAGRS